MPALTAITASASSNAVRSTQRREPVAAAELLGLPRTQRLEAVRGDDVRDAVQQLRGEAGEVGVPGVRVHEVGARDVLGHQQVDAHAWRARVAPRRTRRASDTPNVSGLVARGAEAPHDDLEIAPERPDELGDVHAGSPVDLGRILAGEQVDAHAATLAQRHPTWSDFDARDAPRLTTLVGMATRKIFGIVLAGGEGKRLMPLTEDRAKPAVPFGGQYRLIDFALSNLINSGLRQIVVLTQYKSHSLDRHVSQTWRTERAAELLRRLGAGAAAARQALVLGLGRRHPAEPQPHLRRAARHHRRRRRRPRVPHGLQPDDRGAHRIGRRRRRSPRSASRSRSPTSSA